MNKDIIIKKNQQEKKYFKKKKILYRHFSCNIKQTSNFFKVLNFFYGFGIHVLHIWFAYL